MLTFSKEYTITLVNFHGAPITEVRLDPIFLAYDLGGLILEASSKLAFISSILSISSEMTVNYNPPSDLNSNESIIKPVVGSLTSPESMIRKLRKTY